MDQRKRTITFFSITVLAVSIAIASAAILETNISLNQSNSITPPLTEDNGTITNPTTSPISTPDDQDINQQTEPTPTTAPYSSSGGTITTRNGINLYTDAAATILCTSAEFETITPGTNSTKTLYIKNEGDNTQILHMFTSDWQPSNAGSYLSISWDKENYSLNSGSVVLATLTLNAAYDCGDLTNFGFNLTIEGTT